MWSIALYGVGTCQSEHRERGLSMLERECERVGLPAPSFSQDGVIVKISFMRPDSTSNDTVGVGRNSVEVQSEYSRSTVGVQQKDYKDSVIRLVKVIGEDWFTSYELRETLVFKSKTTFRQNYLNPAIKAGLVTLENPDKPNAPNQRYGLTTKGKALYYANQKADEVVRNDARCGDGGVQYDAQNDVQNKDNDHQNIHDKIIEIIKAEPTIRRDRIANKINISRKTAERHMLSLGIAWLGHPKTGRWIMIKEI